MVLIEEMAAARKNGPMQIFATEIDDEALQFARQDGYPENVAADVGASAWRGSSPKTAQGYQTGETLRNAGVLRMVSVAVSVFGYLSFIRRCRRTVTALRTLGSALVGKLVAKVDDAPRMRYRCERFGRCAGQRGDCLGDNDELALDGAAH